MEERARPSDSAAGRSARSRRTLARVAAGAALAGVLGLVGVARGQRPAPAPLRAIVRDAPMRSALEMVLTAARADFSLDSRVQGLTTADTGAALPLDDVLRALLDGGTMHLELTRADDIYRVTPQAGSPAPRLPAARPDVAAAKPRGVLDVPRRLSGVVLDERGQATHGILETGVPGPGSDYLVEVVTTERSARRVASGFPGEAFLTVEKLTADQLVLRDAKNRKIIAPLRGLNETR